MNLWKSPPQKKKEKEKKRNPESGELDKSNLHMTGFKKCIPSSLEDAGL